MKEFTVWTWTQPSDLDRRDGQDSLGEARDLLCDECSAVHHMTPDHRWSSSQALLIGVAQRFTLSSVGGHH